MNCQPITPNSGGISFKITKKKPEPISNPNENTEFNIVYNGDSFEYSTLPPEGEVLKNDNNK